MENTNRSLFALNGITGMLLAVVVLLSIVAFLGTLAYQTQVANATNFYKTENINEVKMISSTTADQYIKDVK